MTTSDALVQGLRQLISTWASQGVRITVEAGRVRAEVTVKRPPAGALDTIRRLEPEIVAVLEHRPLDTTWRQHLVHWPEEWVEEHGERSAIREFDSGFPRAVADLLAFRDLLERLRQRGGG